MRRRKLSKHPENTIVALILVGFIGIFIFACFGSPLAGGDLSVGYPHTISGTIAQEPSTRYVRTGDGSGHEKVAITLKTQAVPSTLVDAYTNGELVLECHSTRCTQIQINENHTFACRGEGRFLEPNVAVCKHVKKEPK